MSMYICIFIYMYTYIYMFTYVYLYTYIYVYIYTYSCNYASYPYKFLYTLVGDTIYGGRTAWISTSAWNL